MILLLIDFFTYTGDMKYLYRKYLLTLLFMYVSVSSHQYSSVMPDSMLALYVCFIYRAGCNSQ